MIQKKQLKYGLVMPTLSDTAVFRSSLWSLLEGDFQGEIVVVEDGYQPERTCERFCTLLHVKYVKSDKWALESSLLLNLGIKQLGEMDIVIFAHNDILWSPSWFGQLSGAWDKVYSLGKVGIINLGFLQFRMQNSDLVLHELFIHSGYEDLIWLLKSMRHIPAVMPQIADLQSENMERLFGLGRDYWNEHLDKLQIQSGRIAPATSFPIRVWRDSGGYGSKEPLLFDTELHYYCLKNRMWNLWLNNAPLIHMRSADVDSLPLDKGKIYRQKKNESLANFTKKHGRDANHIIFTFFSEIAVIYHDEIVDAVNELRFADVDFIFDKFFERLGAK